MLHGELFFLQSERGGLPTVHAGEPDMVWDEYMQKEVAVDAPILDLGTVRRAVVV